MLILDEAAVRRLLRVEDLIPTMAEALAALSAGQVVQPVRTMVSVAGHQGFLGLMPAYGSALGVKLVAFYPQNQQLPTHHAVIVLFKPETGEPLVTMDGRLITELRTAAVSAVATHHLARPDAAVLALIGSGVQARSHLQALRLVRSFREVRVWSPRHAQAFATEFGVTAVGSAQEAVAGADVIMTATTSTTPVLAGSWLAPGVHINAVGAPRPDWRELDDDVLLHARIYVDSHEACRAESGDIRAAETIVGELGELVAGQVPGRATPDDITLFKSVGLAIEDIAAAELVYRQALANESMNRPADSVQVRGA
jgi:thiomorpholine-carboxylate dehydrogenase